MSNIELVVNQKVTEVAYNIFLGTSPFKKSRNNRVSSGMLSIHVGEPSGTFWNLMFWKRSPGKTQVVYALILRMFQNVLKKFKRFKPGQGGSLLHTYYGGAEGPATR